MKKNILTFITVSAIIFSACAQQKKTTASKATGDKTKNAVSNLEQVAMERTPCFGTCPAYRIEVNKDGHVKYTSWSNTKYEGTYEKDFDPAKVATLFNRFEKYKVDTCQAEYQMMIADIPGINYHFKYKSKEISISNANFGPDFLSELGGEVDKFAQVDGTWKKTAEAGQN